MKKGYWVMLLAFALVISLVACGRTIESNVDDEDDDRPVKRVRKTENPVASPSESPEPETSPSDSTHPEIDPSQGASPEASPDSEDDGASGIIPKDGPFVLVEDHVFSLESLWVYGELADLESENLAILRNAVYAANGYLFKNEKYTSLFTQYAWYKPEHTNVEALLSEIDKRNLNLVLKLEGNFEALYPLLDETEKQMAGFWQHGTPGVAAGYGQLYILDEDRSVTFKENEMNGEERVRALYGKWYVLNETLYMKMVSQDVIVGGELEPASGSTATEYEIVGGEWVHEELKKPFVTKKKLNFDQAALEYGEDCRGVLMDQMEYYDLGRRNF